MIKLELEKLKEIRKMDSKMMSYNVEMTEVTGGTFWKPYSPEQIAETEEFPQLSSPAEMGKLIKYCIYCRIYRRRCGLRAYMGRSGNQSGTSI